MTTTQPQPRGSLPDGEDAQCLYLIKRVGVLRATYQVKLLAFLAHSSGRRLVIIVSAGFTPAPSLSALIEQTGKLIHLQER